MTERADIGYGEDSDDDYTTEMNVADPFTPPGTPATSSSAASLMPTISHKLTIELSTSKLDRAISRYFNPSPRPLVRKRPAKKADDDDSILATLKSSLLQEQIRREEDYRKCMSQKEEEKSRREEERQIREKKTGSEGLTRGREATERCK